MSIAQEQSNQKDPVKEAQEHQDDKAKRGRPFIEPAKKRKISASMYLSQAEHDHFMEIVAESGLSVSNFIRRECVEHITMPKEGDLNG